MKEINRNHRIDNLKGLGILLMILGHCMTVPGPLGRIIGTFHMPLFFIASGFLYKQRSLSNIVSHTGKKVLLPYLVTAIIMWGMIIFIERQYDWGWAILMGNTYKTLGIEGYEVGPLWFLPAFFCAMLFTHFIFAIKKVYIQILIIIAGFYMSIIIFHYCDMLPFGILPGFVGATFICMGGYYKMYSQYLHHPLIILVGFVILLLCMIFGNCAMSWHIYKLQILQLIGAFVATLLIFRILPNIKFGLSNIGKNSLILMCIHSIDRKLCLTADFVEKFTYSDNKLIILGEEFICKILFILTIFYIIKHISLFHRIYNIQ